MRPVVRDEVGWSVSLSDMIVSPTKRLKCWTDRDSVGVVDWGGPKGTCIRCGCTLAQPGEYDWTVHVRWRCAFLSNYFDHLLCLREPEKWDVSERLTDIGRVRYNAAVRCSLMHWKMATNGMLGGMIPIAPLNLSVSHRKWYGWLCGRSTHL